MIKRHIMETVEEYDENGLRVSKRTTETNEEDDETTGYKNVSIPVKVRMEGE